MTYLCIYVIFPYPTLFLIDLLIHPSNSGAPAELHTAIDGMQVVVQPGLYIAQLSTSHDGHGSTKTGAVLNVGNGWEWDGMGLKKYCKDYGSFPHY